MARYDAVYEPVPAGADLSDLEAMVGESLFDHEALEDLIGAGNEAASEYYRRKRDVPRVRPVLVALAARASGAEVVDRDIQHVAELMHGALVVHDVALGREGGRRRRLARKIVRRGAGWLGGNHLALRSMEIARHVSHDVLGELIDTLRAFTDGQALAQELQHADSEVTFEDWLDHADAHTGALFSFCCRAGGHLGGADPSVLSALGRYGRHTGRLWHIAEDLSVVRHAPEHFLARAATGRPVLAVIAAASVRPAIGEAYLDLIRHPRPEAVPAFLEAVETAGGLHEARRVMIKESWAAQRALVRLPDTRYRKAMARLADGVARAGVRRKDDE